MVIFRHGSFVGKTQRAGKLHLVFRLVLPVAPPALGFPEDGRRQAPFTGEFCHIVLNAVFIKIIHRFKRSAPLIAEAERNPGVHHCLTLHHVHKVFRRHSDVGKHVQIRQPADAGAGALAAQGLFAQPPHVLAPLEMKGILLPVAPDRHIHGAGCVLGGAGAQAVQSQGVFVVVAAVGVVFSAGVQLAEHQLPVKLFLLGVPVHRAAAALILHLDGVVGIAGDGDQAAVAFPRFVNGVGQNFKHRVLAAVQPVGAEDHTGALAHPVGALQRGDAFVAVRLFHVRFFLPLETAAAPPLGALRRNSIQFQYNSIYQIQNFHKAQEGRKNEAPGPLPLAQSLCRRQKTALAGAMLPPGLLPFAAAFLYSSLSSAPSCSACLKSLIRFNSP